ncbi:basic proline-rich protein-like [Odontomachus brunneus]|uniref:basic proline-rich protein-like n=1 Tax=Odontomachus brunneus TaxID=486640 RepID=UPI0013F1BA3E|nr:basic proline-rich protein-like [Odontomachus brunneus]
MKPAGRDEHSSDKPQGPGIPRAGPERAATRPVGPPRAARRRSSGTYSQVLQELIRPMTPQEASATWQRLLAGNGAQEAPPARKPPVHASARRPVPRVGTSIQRSRDAGERKLLALAGQATGKRPPATPPTSAHPGPRVVKEETPTRRVILLPPPVRHAPPAARSNLAWVRTAAPPTTPPAPPPAPPAATGRGGVPRSVQSRKAFLNELFGSDSAGSSRETSPTTRPRDGPGPPRPSPPHQQGGKPGTPGPRREVTLPDGTRVTVPLTATLRQRAYWVHVGSTRWILHFKEEALVRARRAGPNTSEGVM